MLIICLKCLIHVVFNVNIAKTYINYLGWFAWYFAYILTQFALIVCNTSLPMTSDKVNSSWNSFK